MKIPILIFLFGLCSIQPSCALKDVLKMGDRLLAIMQNLTNVTTNANAAESMIDTLQDPNTEVGKVIRQLNEFMRELNGMKKHDDLSDIFDMVQNLMTPELELDVWKINLQYYISAFLIKFDHLLEYVEGGQKTPVQTWKTFSRTSMRVIEDHLNSLQIAIFPPSQGNNLYPGPISGLARASQTFRETYCIEASMMHYVLAHLCRATAITEMKGVAVLAYASMIQNATDNEWSTKISNMTNNFKVRFRKYVTRTRNAMYIAPHYVIACDPPNGTWIRDTTYFEMGKIEQVSIFQYNIFARDRNCANAVEKKLFKFDSEIDTCSGTLSDCAYSGALDVCRLKNDTKRYEWIKSDATCYGMNCDKCPDDKKTTYSGPGNSLTGHCICKCSETNNNWISLSPVMTNVAEHMVVTGLRFVRKKGVFHIQVKEGKLLANGWTDPSTENWIPLPEKPELAVINATNKKFYLDDVRVPPEHAVVGIQFEKTDGFSIKVTASKFNHATGQLHSPTIEKVANHTHYEHLPLPRQNSIYTNSTHTPDSANNWIELQHSAWMHDAGQSMLPLFDGVAVETNPPFPVGGVGIVHKGVENYAGFISLKLYPLQYTKTLKNYVIEYGSQEHNSEN